MASDEYHELYTLQEKLKIIHKNMTVSTVGDFVRYVSDFFNVKNRPHLKSITNTDGLQHRYDLK